MKVTDVKNTSIENILSKRHNIWLGISLGNRYFNRDHLRDYLIWAATNTKEKVMVLIADEPQAINYEVFEGMKPETAKSKALRKGDETEKMLTEIISTINGQIQIVRWKDINDFENYEQIIKTITDEFNMNPEFHRVIIEVVKLNMGDRVDDLNERDLDRLAKYVLTELPIFLNGTKFKGDFYDLHIYPGLSLIDDLILNLQSKKEFPRLSEKLNIKHPISIVEAYAD